MREGSQKPREGGLSCGAATKPLLTRGLLPWLKALMVHFIFSSNTCLTFCPKAPGEKGFWIKFAPSFKTP